MKRILLALALAFGAHAQRLADQITVNVVEVPVYVERFGYPISGLTREDFALYVNGVPHRIDYFDVLDEQAAVAATRENADVAPPLNRRRLFVLLFDIGGSSPVALQRAQKSAAKWVAEAPVGDVFAVATSGRSGTHFAVPFATDRVALQRAIATLTSSRARDPFNLATLDVERKAYTSTIRGAEAGDGSFGDVWGQAGLGVALAGSSAADVQNALDTAARFETAESEMYSHGFIDDLSALADRLTPLTGIKHVVLISERSTQALGGTGPAQAAFLHDVLRMQGHYRAAGVVLDAVDCSPPRAPWPGMSGPIPNLGALEVFYTLALDTGGAVVSSLPALRSRNSVTYVLGFQTDGPQKAKNSIHVELKNKRWLTDVRYRKSYSIDSKSTSDDGLFLADALLNDIPQNGLTLDVNVESVGGKVMVAASIPGNELLMLDSGAKEPLLLDVFQYVFNERNLIAAWSHARVALDLARGREFLDANAYTVRKEFELQPGRYSAKVLIRVADAGVAGFRRTNFVVPAP